MFDYEHCPSFDYEHRLAYCSKNGVDPVEKPADLGLHHFCWSKYLVSFCFQKSLYMVYSTLRAKLSSLCIIWARNYNASLKLRKT